MKIIREKFSSPNKIDYIYIIIKTKEIMTIQNRKLIRGIWGIQGLINTLAGLNVDGSTVKSNN